MRLLIISESQARTLARLLREQQTPSPEELRAQRRAELEGLERRAREVFPEVVDALVDRVPFLKRYNRYDRTEGALKTTFQRIEPKGEFTFPAELPGGYHSYENANVVSELDVTAQPGIGRIWVSFKNSLKPYAGRKRTEGGREQEHELHSRIINMVMQNEFDKTYPPEVYVDLAQPVGPQLDRIVRLVNQAAFAVQDALRPLGLEFDAF